MYESDQLLKMFELFQYMRQSITILSGISYVRTFLPRKYRLFSEMTHCLQRFRETMPHPLQNNNEIVIFYVNFTRSSTLNLK